MAYSFSASLVAAKNVLHSAVPLVWLARVGVDATPANDLFLANFDRDLSYDLGDGGGVRTWTRIHWDLADLSEEKGTLSDVRISVSNVTREVQRRLEQRLFLNRRFTLYRVSLGALTTAGHHQSLGGFVIKGAVCNEAVATFALGVFPWLAQPFPGDRFLPSCRFIFKGTDGRCDAQTSHGDCDKTFDGAAGCAGRNNQARFGGFPYLLRGYHPFLP